MALRHRSATAQTSSRLTKPQSKARGGRNALRWAVESLEPRFMLTTLVSSDITGQHDYFIFRNQDGHLQEIKVFGNITAEIIGANVDGGNNVVIENLPGLKDGGPVDGGLNVQPGAILVGPINISDPNGPAITSAPGSIAVNPVTGQMYGIVIQTIPAQGTTPATNIAVLVTIDKTTGTGTVVADITGQILAAAGIAPGTVGAVVTSAPAAAFNPTNGLLYFVATTGVNAGGGGGGGGGGGTPTGTQQLFSLNVNNPTNTVAGIQGNFAGNAVTSIEFTANGTLTVVAGTTVINTVNITNTSIGGRVATANVNGPISGIAEANGKTFVITNAGANSEVYVIDPLTGQAIDYGPLPNGLLGQNPGDLTYDPLTDTLFSFDRQTNQLFKISQINRTRDLSIFQIYISQSDSSGEIVTARVGDDPANLGPMQPFSAGIEGGLRINNAQDGKPNLIASPDGSGDALIGARQRLVDPNRPNDPFVPIITGTVSAAFGNAPYAAGQAIIAGIVGAPGVTIGKVMIGGTVMGQVHIAGNIDTFYAGWLLTGNTLGEGQGNVSDPGNFTVGGDIRNLITTASIGTDSDAGLINPAYVTGFDMHVGGTLGQVHTFDSLIGNVNVNADPAAPNLTYAYNEVEFRVLTNPWDAGILSGSGIFNNDTFQTPQFVGALPATQGGLPSMVSINGTLQAVNRDGFRDYTDYYGVSLMAGQTVTVQVQQKIPPPLVIDVGVFDPDGREIATDYSSIDRTQTRQLPFRFTADRPGVYRFAVAESRNGTFDPTGGPVLGHVGVVPYSLTIEGVGNLPMGAVAATNNILDNVNIFNPEPSFSVLHGDFGALTAGGKIMSFNPNNTVVVPAGNLRDMDASSIGNQVLVNGVFRFSADPEIQVPNGSVGLISATGTGITDILYFNHPLTTPPPIGGDYQVVSGAAQFGANLIANQNIGVIRAGQMTLPFASQFRAGFNNQYGHAFIDLVDCAGDLGTLGVGGPQISTGTGGDFRYMKVGGTMYRDAIFGGGQPEPTIFSPGVGTTIVDDSGSTVNLVPSQATPNPIFNAAITDVNDPRSIQTIPAGQITVTTYGIEGSPGGVSGGSAIVDVTCNGSLTITSSGNVPGQSLEISRLEIQGLGTAVIDTTAVTPALIGNATGIVIPAKKSTQPSVPTPGGTTPGGTTTGGTTGGVTTPIVSITGASTVPGLQLAAFGLPLFVNIGGSAPVDVLNTVVTGNDPEHKKFGDATQITNATGGEMVSLIAESVGQLITSGTLGLAKQHTAAAVNPQQTLLAGNNFMPLGPTPPRPPRIVDPIDPPVVIGNLFPFVQQKIGIEIMHGNVLSMQAKSFGNILVNGGSIGQLTSTSDGTVEAIAGAIAVYDLSILTQGAGHNFQLDAAPNAGRLIAVNLGQGGIAPSGTGNLGAAGIYTDNQIGTVVGRGDIRGSIASATGIDSIKLTGGSIINAHLGQYGRQADTRDIAPNVQIPSYGTPLDAPRLDLGSIIINGSGGIIGAEIVADHLGIIQVNGGFGIFNTSILIQGDGTVGSIRADGYGIRQLSCSGGANLGALIATGSGANVSTQTFSTSVRQGETHQFDPFTGFMPNRLTDINVYTGASASNPQIPGFPGGGTDTGVIEDFIGSGSRDLGTVSAYQIRATDPLLAPSTFNYANSVKSITTRSTIDGAIIVTGRLTNFNPGGDVSHMDMRIAGRISSIKMKGSLLGNSSISALGPNGNIGTIFIAHNLVGSITASRKIGTVTIGQNLAGAVSARSLSTLKIGGSIAGGNLDIMGNVGSIQTGGDLGLPGEVLTIHGAISTIKVGGNINCAIVVQGKLGTLQTNGSIVTGSTTNVTGVLTTLKVAGDVQAGSSVTAHLIKKKIVKGLIQGTITP
ncbi:MAG: hypothetical protein JWN51_289 [Phycisphaerales bacterium]|nr:hypothetical protein [Phycisphaerales bacterium]